MDEVRRGRSVVEAPERAGCHFTIAYDRLRRLDLNGLPSFQRLSDPKGRPPIVRAAELRESVLTDSRTVVSFSAFIATCSLSFGKISLSHHRHSRMRGEMLP
jgi:hypothetical protein